MQHSQRLDQRLHKLREEVRTMTQDKELTERLWRERLQRCQRQLKAKEEEMSRQSQYFENFKVQLQHKLSLAQDREQSLQNRIYTLEKQLLDMTVNAATGTSTIRAVRITTGVVTRIEEQNRMPSMRGEGEGEEEKKEERRKQWQPDMKEERSKVDEGKLETDVDQGENKDTKHTSNEARLQSFIISLQEDLKVLLEREEDGLTKRRRLLEQLQEAQENSHFLGGKVKGMKAEIHQLSLSESSLMQEIEELRGENQKLQQILRDVTNPTPLQSSTKPETTSPRASCSPVVPLNTCSPATAMGRPFVGILGEVLPTTEEKQAQNHSLVLPAVDHWSAAKPNQNNTQDYLSSATSKTQTKHESLNLFGQFSFKSSTDFQSLSVTTESVNEFKLGNLEESPSEESDALREAFQSLGFGDLQALKEQHEHLEGVLQKTQAQLEAMAQENAQLKLQLRINTEEQQRTTEQWSSIEKIITPSTFDRDDHLPSPPAREDAVPAQDDLIQALNQENRALAERIQDLLAHIDLREKEIEQEQTELQEQISRMKEDGVRLEHDNQEQASLIFELNKKTEDDLNTIMELQQKLVEFKEESTIKQQRGSQWESENPAGISERFLHKEPGEKDVDSLVARVLKGDEEAQSIISQETNSLSTAPSLCCQCKNQHELLQNTSEKTLQVSLLTDQVAQPSNSIQSLKIEQEELTSNISSLREQQKEVTLAVQTQTEEKQQLTRTVWALKEQKDSIFKSLSGLKQEREQLSGVVCRLKDEREQIFKSVSDLKKAKEQLNQSLSALQSEKEAVIESLSSGKEERDQIMQSVQGLQMENNQLSQTVLHLKEERDKLTNSLKSLTEQRDQKQLAHTLKEDLDQLVQAISSLKEEKVKMENTITCLKQEKKCIMQKIKDVSEERHSLQVPPIQTEAEEINHKQQLLDPCSAGMTMRTVDESGGHVETSDHRDKFIQNQSDLMRETEALRAELKNSQEEVNKMHVETKRLYSELSESETRRDKAETKADQASEQVIRLTESICQMEDLMKENESLTTQVKELHNKLTVLLREKSDALSLKAQTDEQYDILTAQLKAKSVALEELNSEYISLKRGRGSRDDVNAAFVSLRARYNDIRAKYDALLKRKSQTDLDVAPLKAKLSCLVVKCQQRNCLLVEMMKSMQIQGCVDPRLTQQVKDLLSDSALQEYAATFTPGSYMQTQDCCSGFTQEFFSKFIDHTNRSNRFTSGETCPVVSICVSKQEDGVSPESETRCSKQEKYASIFASETSINLQAETEKRRKNSPGPASPVRESPNVQASPVAILKENMITHMPQLSLASRPTNRPENLGFQHLDMNQKSSSELTRLSSPSLFSSTRVSPNRRLSSPEKILNLHEQLQKTLMSSFQAPESRGREQQPRRTLLLSAQTDLNSPNTKKHNYPLSFQHTHSLVTAKPSSSDKSATLFNAVASRSANVILSPGMSSNHHLKADGFKTNSSISDFAFDTLTPSRDKTNSSYGTKMIKPGQTNKITVFHDVCDATSTSLVISNSDVTNLRLTPSDSTASNILTTPKLNVSNMTSKTDGASLTSDSFTFCSQPAHPPMEKSKKSATEFTAALEKTSRPKPGSFMKLVRKCSLL